MKEERVLMPGGVKGLEEEVAAGGSSGGGGGDVNADDWDVVTGVFAKAFFLCDCIFS